ncbi:Hypothetical predicted protein [Mytilus galloprovincialis]|uniref:Uncharacterized protein n=1 Tax=Mytilus galloprovincialis TaxID=29158 RepID=A0A8B6DXZ4_MYTGA|nr:Hypothetical predicted protein [Mytilus galloprovincialis]
MPDDQTVDFLKQLDRPLNVPSNDITRLYGTNFDAQYMNQIILEDLEEELVVYKGQMGVAVGRAVSIGGLRILNYIAWPKFMEIHKDKEIVRQHEVLPIKAVNQLCDGMPDDQTVDFLKQLDRPLNVPSNDITRLYGTNFDAQYMNQIILEDLEEELVVYKGEEEGNIHLLRDCVVPKNLLLKLKALLGDFVMACRELYTMWQRIVFLLST